MKNFDIIKEFFLSVRCSHCHSIFDEDAIQIIREEHNYTVVKIACSQCQKNVGIVIVGLNKEILENTNDEDLDQLPFELHKAPIDYDDVIDAHNFFYNLGSDWSKHLPEDS